MDNAAYNQFTTTTTDMTKMIVQGQADLLETFSTNAKGTPIAPLFDMAAQVHRSAMDNLNMILATADAKPLKSEAKASTATVKKASNAQTGKMVEAGSKAVATNAKTKKKIAAKVTKAAPSSKMAVIYDDLTAVAGIGPSTMKKLHEEGIRTVSDLASTSSKELNALLEKANIRILKYSPKDWIADAKNLLKASKAA